MTIEPEPQQKIRREQTRMLADEATDLDPIARPEIAEMHGIERRHGGLEVLYPFSYICSGSSNHVGHTTMCGRAKLETDVSEIKIAFRIPPEYPTPNFAPSWNVAPTDDLPIVRYDQKAGSRTLDLMRWGLVPYWAKDIKIGFSTINAMAETVDTKPVFREAFKRRRCLVPIETFYE